MNLLTVLEAKQDFSRPGQQIFKAGESGRSWTTEDVLSEEWYVIEEAISITRHDFFVAVADSMKELGMTYYGPYGNRKPLPGDVVEFKDWKLLASKLGFK